MIDEGGRERDRESERENVVGREREKERGREGECVCITPAKYKSCPSKNYSKCLHNTTDLHMSTEGLERLLSRVSMSRVSQLCSTAGTI